MQRKGWEARLTAQSPATKIVHVLPVRDLRAHQAFGDRCWCRPAVDRVEAGNRLGVIVVHHAADGRELVEQHGVN